MTLPAITKHTGVIFFMQGNLVAHNISVWLCGNDEESGKEIGGNTVGRTNVIGAADDGVSTVRSEDNDGRNRGFEGPVQISETFDVKHVDFVDE